MIPKYNQWIFDAVIESIEDVSCDRVGCVIVKKCIDHINEEQKVFFDNKIILIKKKLKQLLAKKVTIFVLKLVQDPFGNYVVQHIMDKFPNESISQQLITCLLGNINELCVQKFSSNVVEKVNILFYIFLKKIN